MSYQTLPIKRRISQYDLIRSLAIFFVFCIHSLGVANEEYAKGGFNFCGQIIYNAFNTIVYTAVPLFVMLSGALLLGGANRVEDFLGRRFKRILIPFIWWSIILFGLSIFKEHKDLSIMLIPEFINKFLTYGIHGVYWYVYLIIGLYLITPLLRPFFRNANHKELLYAFSICTLFVIISALFPDVRWVKGFHSDYFVYIAYFICGYIIAHYLRDLKYTKDFSLIVTLVILVLCTINGIYKFTTLPLDFFMSLSLFTLMLYVPIKETKPLLFVSNASYGMYLSHVVFISIFLKLGFSDKLPLWIEPFAMACIVMIAECALMLVIKKMKLNRWLN